MNAPRTEAFQKFLRAAAVFGGLEGRSLRSVLSRLEVLKFPKGKTVFSEGELGRTMYVVYRGEVEVQARTEDGKQVPIVRLGPGECFGEMALVELQPRSATVVTTKPTVLYSLSNLDLYSLFQQDHFAYVIVLQNICRLLSRRLRKADSRICGFVAVNSRKGARSRAREPRARA